MIRRKMLANVIVLVALGQCTAVPAFAADPWNSSAAQARGAFAASGTETARAGNSAVASGDCIGDEQYLLLGPTGKGDGRKRLEWRPCDEEPLFRGETAEASSEQAGSGKANLASRRLPVAVWLLGSGIVGLIGISRRKRKNGRGEDPQG